MTNPQGPPNQGPPTWSRPGNQGSFGQTPTERMPAGQPSQETPAPAPVQQPDQTDRMGASHAPRPRPPYTPPPNPPTTPAERVGGANDEPAGRRKRGFLRDPLAILLVCIIVFALLVGGLVGAELYARHVADTKVAEAVACEVKDRATASFGVTPLLLWQLATEHFTNISVSTAGNQIRDAKGMKIALDIKDVRLKSSDNSKGTVGSLDATITWTAEGIKQTVQNSIPVLGPFVTNSVTAHPRDGTIELKGMLDDITAKPIVQGKGLRLQIQTFNALGFTLPKESVQSTLDEFTTKLTQNYPLGIHADSVQVTDTGVVSKFSTRNATIPAGGGGQDPCFANL
ncbi:LmeA family phospholipid-binding protein [Mycobacterium sp. Lab-001]|uniref:LmeA family phospholipid-binding protein n=1 Tax=Mycobacterium sp. Lab-001 TaxID=3410136 RepID=UPI003D17370D